MNMQKTIKLKALKALDRYILILLMAIAISSCKHQQTNKPTQKSICDRVKMNYDNSSLLSDSIQDNSSANYDSLQHIVLDQSAVIDYLNTFRMLLLMDSVIRLSDLVDYPLQGDCFWYKIYTQKELDAKGNRRFMKEDFIKYHSKLFDKDVIMLFKQFNFDKSFDPNEYVETIQVTKDKQISMYVQYIRYMDEENSMPFEFCVAIGAKELDSEGEIMYVFKKVNGKIKLYSIQCAG